MKTPTMKGMKHLFQKLTNVRKYLCRFFTLIMLISCCNNNVFAQLMINEIGKANLQDQAFIELVAQCENGKKSLDIRNWIIDDNSKVLSQYPIAKGHARFTDASQWADVPCGAILVIYNDEVPNDNLPPDDPTDSNGDLVYVIPAKSPLLQEERNTPSIENPEVYLPAYEAFNWSSIELTDNAGMFQVINPNTLTTKHLLKWTSSPSIELDLANITNLDVPLVNQAFQFANQQGDDFFKQVNWQVKSLEKSTPGLPNSPANEDWIEKLRENKNNTPKPFMFCEPLPKHQFIPTTEDSAKGNLFVAFDRFGSTYSLEDIMFEPRKKNISCPQEPEHCLYQSGYNTGGDCFCEGETFDVVFDFLSGSDDLGEEFFFDVMLDNQTLTDSQKPLGEVRREVLCEVVKKLSKIIQATPNTCQPQCEKATLFIGVSVYKDASSGAIGSATPYYWSNTNMPLLNEGYIMKNPIWRHLTGNADPKFTYRNAGLSPAHALIRINSVHPFFYNLEEERPSDSEYEKIDFYTFLLHEFIHAFGFISGINEDGSGLLNGQFRTYEKFSTFLKLNNEERTPLITHQNCSEESICDLSTCYNRQQVPKENLSNKDCEHIIFDSKAGNEQYPIFAGNENGEFKLGSSLIHLSTCKPNSPDFVMKPVGSYNEATRNLTEPELNILADIGYCLVDRPELDDVKMAGVDDPSCDDFYYVQDPCSEEFVISKESLLANDKNVTDLTCLMVETISYQEAQEEDNNNLQFDGTTLTYDLQCNPGIHILSYIPLNGSEIGSKTYIYITAAHPNSEFCLETSDCNLICNPNLFFPEEIREEDGFITNSTEDMYMEEIFNASGWLPYFTVGGTISDENATEDNSSSIGISLQKTSCRDDYISSKLWTYLSIHKNTKYILSNTVRLDLVVPNHNVDCDIAFCKGESFMRLDQSTWYNIPSNGGFCYQGYLNFEKEKVVPLKYTSQGGWEKQITYFDLENDWDALYIGFTSENEEITEGYGWFDQIEIIEDINITKNSYAINCGEKVIIGDQLFCQELDNNFPKNGMTDLHFRWEESIDGGLTWMNRSETTPFIEIMPINSTIYKLVKEFVPPANANYTITGDVLKNEYIIVSVDKKELALNITPNQVAYCINDEVRLLGTPGIGNIIIEHNGNTTTLPNNSAYTFETAGAYTISYQIGDGSCGVEPSETVIVNPDPEVSFEPLQDTYCVDDEGDIPLVGEPLGGIFTDNGIEISGSLPRELGTHVIEYTYVDGVTNCIGVTSQTINIIQCCPDEITIGSMFPSTCVGDEINLFEAFEPNPDNGIFVGDEVDENGIFKPTSEGNAIIIYTIEECEDKDTYFSIQVINEATIEDTETYCLGEVMTLIGNADYPDVSEFFVSFIPANEIGGESQYFDTGDELEFDQVGTYTIKYTNECGTDEKVVTIEEASFDVLDNYCIESVISLVGTPSGGTFTIESGQQVSTVADQTEFTVTQYGQYNITYSYTNSTGDCNSTINQVVEVPELCCINPSTEREKAECCIQNKADDYFFVKETDKPFIVEETAVWTTLTHPWQAEVESSNGYIRINNDLIIPADVVLTLGESLKFEFGLKGRIIVESKGQLAVGNNCTFNGDLSCKTMWQGIQIEGGDFPGKLNLTGTGIIINDAILGIATMRLPSLDMPNLANALVSDYMEFTNSGYGHIIPNFDVPSVDLQNFWLIGSFGGVQKQGGNFVITATGEVNFHNCFYGINNSYHPSKIIIQNCSFTSGGSKQSGLKYPLEEIEQTEAGIAGIVFNTTTAQNCTFSNIKYGFRTHSSEEAKILSCTFQDCKRGVSIKDFLGSAAIEDRKIENSSFKDCEVAIQVDGTEMVIRNNCINLTEAECISGQVSTTGGTGIPLAGTGQPFYGILSRGSYALVEGNKIKGHASSMYIIDNDEEGGMIRKNHLYKPLNGVRFAGHNEGIDIRCNNFVKYFTGISLLPWSNSSSQGILSDQGNCPQLPGVSPMPAGNTFLNNNTGGFNSKDLYHSSNTQGYTYSDIGANDLQASTGIDLIDCETTESGCELEGLGILDNTDNPTLTNLLIQEKLRELAAEDKKDEMIKLLEENVNRFTQQKLVPHYIREKEWEKALTTLDAMEITKQADQDFQAFHQLLIEIGQNEQNIQALTQDQLMTLREISNHLNKTAYNAQTLLYLSRGLDFKVRFPQEEVEAFNTRSKTSTTTPKESNITITPNPLTTKGYVNYQLPNDVQGNLSIYDITGRLMTQQEIQGTGSYNIDATTYKQGIYFCIISTPNEILFSDKLMIVH